MSADIADLSHAAQSAMVEVRQYVPDAHIGRHEDPLAWLGGGEGRALYPSLARMARRYLGMIATSVPSERVFSKSGQLQVKSSQVAFNAV